MHHPTLKEQTQFLTNVALASRVKQKQAERDPDAKRPTLEDLHTTATNLLACKPTVISFIDCSFCPDHKSKQIPLKSCKLFLLTVSPIKRQKISNPSTDCCWNATASAVHVSALASRFLFAILADVILDFSLVACPCFFSPSVFLILGLHCAALKQATDLDVFPLVVVTSTSFFVFVFFSLLSCLTSSGIFRGRGFPLSSIAQTLHASIAQ